MDMDFPILTLLDTDASVAWLEQHFHPDGFGCPHCQASLADARRFRTNRGSGLSVYRCRACYGVYTLYTRTLFEGCHLLPAQVVLLLRGVFQGQSSAQLARELELTEKTVLKWRHRLQSQAERIQPFFPLADRNTESDEMFQNAGEKGTEHFEATDPPRVRAGYPLGETAWARDVRQRPTASAGDSRPADGSGTVAGGDGHQADHLALACGAVHGSRHARVHG